MLLGFRWDLLQYMRRNSLFRPQFLIFLDDLHHIGFCTQDFTFILYINSVCALRARLMFLKLLNKIIIQLSLIKVFSEEIFLSHHLNSFLRRRSRDNSRIFIRFIRALFLLDFFMQVRRAILQRLEFRLTVPSQILRRSRPGKSSAEFFTISIMRRSRH